ncbi:type I toxin-antitoxin system toxin MokC, partial [Escherichia coli]|nr:type I toxin-antitoxin system toxin MokC [Escherichia coli]
MKQHKAMIVALIVICITAVVAALVTRKDLCEVHIRI